jgi:hypothetical protein
MNTIQTNQKTPTLIVKSTKPASGQPSPDCFIKLNEKYITFCNKQGIDEDLKPQEQYDVNESQQLWIDRHLNAVSSLRVQMLLSTKYVITIDEDVTNDDLELHNNDDDMWADKALLTSDTLMSNFPSQALLESQIAFDNIH